MERNNEACRKKYQNSKMINTTKKKATATVGVPKNKTVQRAMKAGNKAKVAKQEVAKHGPRDKLKWLREVRKFQKTTQLLIKKAPFQRLVRELVADINPYYRIQGNAFMALHEASESFLLKLFEFSNYIAIS